jgi:hypothetical protein
MHFVILVTVTEHLARMVCSCQQHDAWQGSVVGGFSGEIVACGHRIMLTPYTRKEANVPLSIIANLYYVLAVLIVALCPMIS